MSSHREAPEISKDPVADSTDVYAFVSPDRPDTVTLISNYIPLEDPAGGPNFFEFGDDVVYRLNVINDDDIDDDVAFEFRFKTVVTNPNTFLYNTGPITALDSASWNRRQSYSVSLVTEDGGRKVLGKGLACPPCNIGPRSTPDYASLAAAAVHDLGGGIKVFAGQRKEGFWVDLGSIFDLGTLRPFQHLHLIPSAAAVGVNAARGFNVHSIAIQVPISMLTADGSTPTDPMAKQSVIGVYASASRRKAMIRDKVASGPFVQVSRLGNPLFNEVLVPMSRKDEWNKTEPRYDSAFAGYVQKPELAGLLPVLYPGVFPKLAALTAPRADLDAILLTGIPAGIVPGFQNYTGPIKADLLRLNVAIKPSSAPNPLGIIGGDLAGFPNGRRVIDDVVTVELRAVAGATYPLVDPTYVPDGAAALVADGTAPPPGFLDHFPYLGVPISGYDSVPPS
jgi:Domain of unknown function (DUF4331)